MKILITGASGFLGTNLQNFFRILNKSFGIVSIRYPLNNNIDFKTDVILHLSGIAHDLKNKLNENNYFESNYELTKQLFDAFLNSDANIFIFISSVKAVAYNESITEDIDGFPSTAFGMSKRLAENYLLSQHLTKSKKLFILRPCMIHGPGNKGNLNLLYKLVSKNIPWPLGAFENQRSFCSIDNLMFIFKELIERDDIPSGIYNVADDEPLSTNELIWLIAQSQNRNAKIWNFSKRYIAGIASIGDKLRLLLNTERLHKLTSSYVVSNAKIKAAIGKPLPVSSREGLLKTFKSFNR
jgi:nucleoside-diphosphate-sugar epimerase